MPKLATVPYPHLVFRVHFLRSDGGYYHISGLVERADGSARSLFVDEEGGRIRGVRLWSQADRDSIIANTHDYASPFYAIRIGWGGDDTEGCTLDNCRDGAAALAPIERYLAKIQNQHGRPASFGVYVQRFATALGVGHVRFASKHSHGGIRDCSPADSAYAVDRQIAEWQQEARHARGLPEVA